MCMLYVVVFFFPFRKYIMGDEKAETAECLDIVEYVCIVQRDTNLLVFICLYVHVYTR